MRSLRIGIPSWQALPRSEPSCEGVTGNATLNLNGVTLDYLGRLLPDSDVDVGGEASAALRVSRSDGDAVPNLELSAETKGLRVSVPRKIRYR